MGFNSNPVDITYGRHTITFEVANGATLGTLYVTVPAARLTEILDVQDIRVSNGPAVNNRIVELERRVQQLEIEIAALKKKKTAH
jgi:flagellar motor switch protein FliM